MRAHVQAADSYLAAYGVVERGSKLQLRIAPNARIDPSEWPAANRILEAVAVRKEIGEQVVSAFNRLPQKDQYLVKLPQLHK